MPRANGSGNALVHSLCDTYWCDLTRADLPLPDPNLRRTPTSFGTRQRLRPRSAKSGCVSGRTPFFGGTFDNRIDTTPVGMLHPVCAHPYCSYSFICALTPFQLLTPFLPHNTLMMHTARLCFALCVSFPRSAGTPLTKNILLFRELDLFSPSGF